MEFVPPRTIILIAKGARVGGGGHPPQRWRCCRGARVARVRPWQTGARTSFEGDLTAPRIENQIKEQLNLYSAFCMGPLHSFNKITYNIDFWWGFK